MLYIMYFIYNSAPLKEEYEKDGAKGENLNSSIFPENRIDGGSINRNLGQDSQLGFWNSKFGLPKSVLGSPEVSVSNSEFTLRNVEF